MRFSLGPQVVLDSDSFEIRVDGESVRVEPQVFDVMLCLISNAERVVTKGELLDTVWGDRYVSESALTSRIKTARKVMGDDGRNQHTIRTIHGRGYQWIGPVSTADNPTDGGGADGGGADGTAPDGGVLDGSGPGRHDPADGDTAPANRRPSLDVAFAPSALAEDGVRAIGDRSDWPLVGRQSELETIADRFATSTAGGVLISGPAGMGKTRLAEEALHMAEYGGVAVARVRGHVEAQDIPLACFAHLLPSDLTEIVGPDGDLSRTLLFQEAVNAMSKRAGDGRLLLHVDDVNLVDDLSQAVISSLIQSGRVFVVATERAVQEETTALPHLVADGAVERIELGPVSEDALAIALYRSLDAPLDPRCLDLLLTACGGVPGVLRQLVENSIHHGGLRLEDGVWNLVGDLTPPNDLAELVEDRLRDLEDDHRQAAELLALAGALELGLAVELAGEEQLDALDLRGMLAVENTAGRTEVRLAHPLYGEALRAKVQPLRARRLRSRLADAFEADGLRHSSDRLRLAQWRLDEGGAINPDDMLEAARLAVLHKDHETARTIVDRLQREAPSARVGQLAAELHFRQGSSEAVEQILSTIDLDELEPAARAQVVRRRTMNLFYGLMESELPFEILDREIAGAEGAAQVALEAHSLSMKLMTADLAESLTRCRALLPNSEGPTRLEVLRSIAYATWGVGDYEACLDIIREADRFAETIGPSLSRPGLALSQMVEMYSLVYLGRISEARAIVDAIGPAMTFGWLPVTTARVSMYEGRPTVAAELLTNPLGIAEAVGQDFAAAWMRATMAEIERQRGNLEQAKIHAAKAEPFISNERPTVAVDMSMMLAPIKAESGNVEDAQQDVLRGARLAHEVGFASGMVLSLHTAAVLGAADEARQLLDELDPPRDVWLSAALTADIEAWATRDGPALFTSAERFEASGYEYLAAQGFSAAATMGDAPSTDEAARRLRAVLKRRPGLVRF